MPHSHPAGPRCVFPVCLDARARAQPARPCDTFKGRDFPPSFVASVVQSKPDTSPSASSPSLPSTIHIPQLTLRLSLDSPSTAHAPIRPFPGLSPTGQTSQTSQAIPCILSIVKRHHRASRTPCAYIISTSLLPPSRIRDSRQTIPISANYPQDTYIRPHLCETIKLNHNVLLRQLRAWMPWPMQRPRRPMRLLRHSQPSVDSLQ